MSPTPPTSNEGDSPPAFNDVVVQLTVESPEPIRLDRWLTAALTDLSRNRVQKLIDWEYVVLNGAICTQAKTPVQTGDQLQVTFPESKPVALVAQAMDLHVLYEDNHLLVINKPAGLVVHPAPGHREGTLVNGVLAHCGDRLAGIGGEQRPGIVHRLDKNTTGAIVVAKTDLAHQSLQAQIKAKTARREYLGVVYGSPSAESGTVDAPIGRHPGDRKKQAVIPLEHNGRSAVTHWQVRERLGNYSLLHFQLETGRTHQIRVHSAHMGHPIVGDPDYSQGRSVGVNLPGQALHAWRLTFIHPVSATEICTEAPLPTAFETLLAVLRRRQ